MSVEGGWKGLMTDRSNRDECESASVPAVGRGREGQGRCWPAHESVAVAVLERDGRADADPVVVVVVVVVVVLEVVET